MAGSGILCANSAMRSGAGLVTLGLPSGLRDIAYRRISLEVMLKVLPQTKAGTLSLGAYADVMDMMERADVLAVGPGLSRNPRTQGLVRKLLKNISKPAVIDADAINALCGHLDILKEASRSNKPVNILTPHLGEFSRLTGAAVSFIKKNTQRLAKSFAKDYNIILVLKSHNTLVASGRGDIYVNKTGNPGMATAGSGDCLTGIISSLMAQGLKAFDAAKLGVYLHGIAGDLAAKEKTQAALIASDIIEKLPLAINKSKGFFCRRSSVGRAIVL